MTGTSLSNGHKIYYEGKDKSWRFSDTKEKLTERPCKNCERVTQETYVKIPKDLSSTGEIKWRFCHIDACVQPIVHALQINGIDMRGSCCGHNLFDGYIHLQDGRVLVVIRDGDYYFKNQLSYYLKRTWIYFRFYLRIKYLRFKKFLRIISLLPILFPLEKNSKEPKET